MTITKLSSREFDGEPGKARKAAKRGPVFIMDRGRPSYVLLTVEEYRKLSRQKSIVDLLAMPKAAAIKFEPPRLDKLHKPVDLS